MTTTAFETEVCSRCLGTGHYSFNGTHSRCYKCEGKNGGRAYTKRGAAAKDFYLALRRKPAAVVAIGDKVRSEFIKQLTVVTIERYMPTFKRTINGVLVEPEEHFRFSNTAGLQMSVPVNGTVDVLPTVEENEAMIAKALAYQETLTKKGTVHK